MNNGIKEQHPHGGGWLREIVFGLNDGLVTTLVFIVAVSTVTPTHLIPVALGEMLAGSVSMGLGGYLSARTTADVLEQRIATERLEIRNEPEEERAELRAIYQRKGLNGALLDRVVEHLTATDERWLHSMMADELGLVDSPDERPSWVQGLMVGASFMIGAFVPIVPFALGVPAPQVVAYGLTALTAVALGWIKARYTLKGPLRNSLELLGVITLGAAAGVAIGALISR